MEEYEKNFGSKKAAELWENFLTQVGVKGGKKFLLSMNLLVGKGKAGRIHFFMKLSFFYILLVLGIHLLRKKSKHSFWKFRADADVLDFIYIMY